MKKEFFTYSYGWRTASETYKFYLNGKRVDLPSETEAALGYKVICGKVKEAEDELKRIVRKERKRENLISLGFMEKDSNTQYLYSCARWLLCEQYNMTQKIEAYKTIKRDLIKKGCKEIDAISATLGKGFEIEETVEKYTYVDINRLKKIYVKIV